MPELEADGYLGGGEGVATFGTWALLSVLIKAGLIPDTSQEDALVLAAEGVINLAMASDEASA